MADEKRVDFSIKAELSNKDGIMFTSDVTWNDVPYSGAVLIQDKLAQLLKEMNDLGYDMAENFDPEGLKLVKAHKAKKDKK